MSWDPYDLAGRGAIAGAKADLALISRYALTVVPLHQLLTRARAAMVTLSYGSAGLKPQEEYEDAASKVKDQVLTRNFYYF